MKGKTTYQFKKILFQSSRIDIASGWYVGNKADNPACRYPKRGTDRDLIYNHSAITLENLMSGKLKAALLNMEDGTQILYFQYQSSTNGQIQAVVMPEHPMRIEVDRDVDDHYASYLAVQFMSACYLLISPDASPYGSIREGFLFAPFHDLHDTLYVSFRNITRTDSQIRKHDSRNGALSDSIVKDRTCPVIPQSLSAAGASGSVRQAK